MIKVGNMLINPEDISSIHQDMKALDSCNSKTRGLNVIQIIYKNGVVKNITSAEVGMSYNDFINAIQKLTEKQEDDRLFRTMAALKSLSNV